MLAVVGGAHGFARCVHGKMQTHGHASARLVRQAAVFLLVAPQRHSGAGLSQCGASSRHWELGQVAQHAPHVAPAKIDTGPRRATCGAQLKELSAYPDATCG